MSLAHPKCVALRDRWYIQAGWEHAYRHYERAIVERLDGGKSILDVGCGRTFPLAGKFLARTDAVFGIDPVADPSAVANGAVVKRGTGDAIPFDDGSFDLVVCRSVLEHVERPAALFADVARVLKAGGVFVFLTPSRYDYVSLAARLIPNRWHPWIIRRLEGRAEEDTFPTYYRANSRAAVSRHARRAGLAVQRLDYLNHPPTYFMSSPTLYRVMNFYDRLVCRFEALGFLRGWLLGALAETGQAR